MFGDLVAAARPANMFDRRGRKEPERARPADASLDAFKYDYDAATEKWRKSTTRVLVDATPFAHGGMRECFHAREIDGADVVQSVLKVFKDPVPANVYFDECQVSSVAETHAQAFNRLCASRGLPHSVAFLPCAVICCPASEGGFELGTLEPYLPGDYTKHSDNAGHVETDDEVAKAFSWFTYVTSERLLVVCDIQGVGSFYTDPQIHTWDGEGFGLGNMGAEGLEQYLATTTRNLLIDQLGLPPLDAGETDEEVARRLQRAEEEDYGGDLVSFE